MAVDPETHILVVDDVEVVRRDVALQLKRIGFTNVDTAEDGLEAFTKLRAGGDYGLVISDLMMKQASGLDLLRSIRADREMRDLRFVMISGHNNSDSVTAAKRAGADAYIVKPFNSATLRQRLELVLGPIPPAPSPLPALGS
jgi:two-component system, chemotaxis family, chemotaxis protein CheY